MPYFRYKATSPDGSIAGFIRAKDEEDAKQTLVSRNYSVTDLRSYHGTPTDVTYVMVSDGFAKGANNRNVGLNAVLGILLVIALLGTLIWMWPESKPESPAPTPTRTPTGSQSITILGTLKIKGTHRIWNPIEGMECTFHLPAPQRPIIQTRKIAIVRKDGSFNCKVVVPTEATVVDVIVYFEGGVRTEFEGIPISGSEVKLPVVTFSPEG